MKTVVFLLLVLAFSLFAGEGTVDSTSPVGTYVAKLPSASGMGRIAIIHIFENGNAMRSNIYIGKPEGDYIEEGKWSLDNDVLKVELKVGESKMGVALMRTLKFKFDGKDIVSIKYDETPFGKKEIKFTRIPEFNEGEER